MVRISTFVFFDIETTGLPHLEYNRTKIIEFSLLAVHREDMRRVKDNKDTLPPVCKLSFLLNPEKSILSKKVTGLDNDMVKYAATFKQKFNTINSFLEDLTKPVCLVAHNGNVFDYKILLAECVDAGVILPADLLCADSLKGFKTLLSNKPSLMTSVLTDDEDDEWPDLNITPEEFQEKDGLCTSLGNTMISKNINTKTAKFEKKKRESYRLTDIYRRLYKKEPENAHRAEGDCLMLMQCVRFCQNTENMSEDFLFWIDENCKKLSEITPLQRKNRTNHPVLNLEHIE